LYNQLLHFNIFIAVLSSKVVEVGTEVDNVLPLLEVKEFTVDASTLITVQHLIQWTVNFILRLLTNLPDWRNAPRGTMVLIHIFKTFESALQNNRTFYIHSAIYYVILSC